MRGCFFKPINTDGPDNVQFTGMVKLVPNEMQAYAVTHIPLFKQVLNNTHLQTGNALSR